MVGNTTCIIIFYYDTAGEDDEDEDENVEWVLGIRCIRARAE